MKAVLIDLDGVLYVGDEVVPGAVEAVGWLVEKHIPHLFLTNTTSRPVRALVEKLQGMGIPVDGNDFLTPALAARGWLESHVTGRAALLVPRVTWEDLPEPHESKDVPSAVVVGDLGQDWDYAKLNQAFQWLMAPTRPPLLALGLTRYWRASDGLRLDVGGMVKALEYAAGCEAVVLGKPSADFFGVALAKLNAAAADTVMIGDDIVGDVGGAQQAGLHGVLVRTGKFSERDLAGEVRPDAVLDSIAELPAWWKQIA